MERPWLYLNRKIFLYLLEYEYHCTYYSFGGFYAKHLNAFKHNPNRIVPTLIYLNLN